MEKQRRGPIPQILFTFEQLELLYEVLVPLEQMARTSKPLPNVEFALTMIAQVRAKIGRMMQEKKWDVVVGFDENEVLMIQAGVDIYLVTLEMLEPSPQREEEKKKCQVLSALFTPLL